ncbi:MAG: class GN sortase [Methylococcales bacterium]|jgi:sortase A|nr:class GN sortase [Methylococcales bacterium]MBT7410102.1 class GN sortase [Methylococcales bacterium]
MSIKVSNYWLFACLSGIVGLLFLVNGLTLSVKALLAQTLIHNAWQQVQHEQKPQLAKPWPWADTYPVAQLMFADKSLYVLNGATGEALSFGPGHYTQTVLPGTKGDSVIAGHRDSHFAVLKTLKMGDIITAKNYLGESQRYKVEELKIIDSRKEKIQFDNQQNRLQLITCYPFDKITAGGPLRYVVMARFL